MSQKQIEAKQVSQWVELTQSGDERGLVALYQHYNVAIYRFCFWHSHDRAVAQDLCSETWMQVISSIKSFRNQGNFRNWLYTIAKRQVYAWLREKYSQERLEEYHALVPDNDSYISEEASALKEAFIKKLLAKLSEKQRTVLKKRFLQNYSVKEVSQEMKISVSQVKVISYRAKKKLLELAKGSG